MKITASSAGATYGGNLINQKYKPIDRIILTNEDKDETTKLFTKRMSLLSSINAFPKTLRLFTNKWPTANEIDVDVPPMVVISSSRAEWLKTMFDNEKELGDLTGYNDAGTFRGYEYVPVMWYSPKRTGNRPLFIVVHNSEYGYYRKQLAAHLNNNIRVVGWRFPYAQGKFGIGPVGFGASRFAALELVKELGYHKAWAVDDNVININGFPNTLATIETLMDDDEAICGIGFKGATENIAAVNNTVTLAAKVFDFGDQKAGLLQQVVLWNLDLLKANKTTMSPFFVSSNEDVSMTNFIKKKNYKERVIKALEIIKLNPYPDTSNKGAKVLGGLRAELLERLFALEKTNQIQDGMNTVYLDAFIKNTVLKDKEGSVLVAQSQAIECVLAEATELGWAPPAIFDPYSGFNGTKVELQAAG